MRFNGLSGQSSDLRGGVSTLRLGPGRSFVGEGLGEEVARSDGHSEPRVWP